MRVCMHAQQFTREVHICSSGSYLRANLRSHLAGVELPLELVDMLKTRTSPPLG